MEVLRVEKLRKRYPAFQLDGVSFHLEPGKITGFIGRNGAGKSTTLNALFDFVHPDGGEVLFFGEPFSGHEAQAKQRTGFVASGVNYYPRKKLKTISAITRSFYAGWDAAAYEKYLRLFGLDENKSPAQLSAGMKVKYALTLALSHSAELLILDEPTSGLDPVSRDDLLDVLLGLCAEGKTILFSTHITSDLDKCAENIIYIKDGRIIAESSVKAFESGYRIAAFETGRCPEKYEPLFVGRRLRKDGFTALVKAEDAGKLDVALSPANLEEIMIHLEKEADQC